MQSRQIGCSACGHTFNVAVERAQAWILCPRCGHSDEAWSAPSGPPPSPAVERVNTDPSQPLARISLRRMPRGAEAKPAPLATPPPPPATPLLPIEVPADLFSLDEEPLLGAADDQTLINTDPGGDVDPGTGTQATASAAPADIDALRRRLGLEEATRTSARGGELELPPEAETTRGESFAVDAAERGERLEEATHSDPGTGVDLPGRPLPVLFSDEEPEEGTGIDLPPRPARGPETRRAPAFIEVATGFDLPQRPAGKPVDMDMFDPATQTRQHPGRGAVAIEADLGGLAPDTDEQVVDDDDEGGAEVYFEPAGFGGESGPSLDDLAALRELPTADAPAAADQPTHEPWAPPPPAEPSYLGPVVPALQLPDLPPAHRSRTRAFDGAALDLATTTPMPREEPRRAEVPTAVDQAQVTRRALTPPVPATPVVARFAEVHTNSDTRPAVAAIRSEAAQMPEAPPSRTRSPRPAPAVLPDDGIMVFVPDRPVEERKLSPASAALTTGPTAPKAPKGSLPGTPLPPKALSVDPTRASGVSAPSKPRKSRPTAATASASKPRRVWVYVVGGIVALLVIGAGVVVLLHTLGR